MRNYDKSLDVEKAKIKIKVKQEIIETINRICTGDHNTCGLGYCQFNGECGKPFFEVKTELDSLHYLKVIKKQVSKTKKTNKRKPEFVRRPHHDKVSEILGQDVFDHELVKGNSGAIQAIQKAGSHKSINKILATLHLLKYKRPKFLHWGRRRRRK